MICHNRRFIYTFATYLYYIYFYKLQSVSKYNKVQIKRISKLVQPTLLLKNNRTIY